MKSRTNEICHICGNEFVPGVNGTIEGCDKCCGVRRDRNGYAWFPREKYHTYMDINSKKVYTVKRPKGI